MKIINSKILIATLVFGFLTSCKTNQKIEIVPNDSFKVSGTLNGIDVPYMFIDYTDDLTGDRVWDTLYIKEGSFTYASKLTNTKRIAIWPLLARPKKPSEGVKGGYVEFLARPGDNIVFEGDVTETFNAIPTGTVLCDDINRFNESIKKHNEESKEIMDQLSLLEREDPKIKTLYAEVLSIGDRIDEIKKTFIKNNPSSEVAAFYLDNMVQIKSVEDAEALALLNGFDETLKASPFYINVSTRLKGSEATKAGNLAPEVITNRTLDGSEFDLKSLRGKYVMIDFWGIWCGPCMKEMPTVKEYSKKYKDKLAVVGIDSGDTKEKVVDFTTKNNYDWIQLLSKKGINEDNFVSKFNVNGFPTKFIIDPEGIIIGKYVGGSEEAFTLLDKLLNK
ncbi:TlpA family protein disulfide reductase [Formosa haliotis]|uniref:TlpA family protein disulfide reductase n=1 Tax=Formosa haliotis TaxID=1555194 RepID=UPI000824159C|nr:TlpA disulfide reductase family protein [Formosa haliotis]